MVSKPHLTPKDGVAPQSGVSTKFYHTVEWILILCFLTTDFSQSQTEILNRLRRVYKITFNYNSFSVIIRVLPW